MMDDLEVGGAVSAVYDAVKGANLKAGLPAIYIEDADGQEKKYSIRDIENKKEMPGNLARAYFEFGQGKDFSLICLSLNDCNLSTDNFTNEDETVLKEILKQVDLRRPLTTKSSFEEVETEVVNLAGMFPEPEAPAPRVNKRVTKLSEEEFKKYVTHILREDRNTTFSQIMGRYSGDGFKLPNSYKIMMEKMDEYCEWYNQVRKSIRMDPTSNFGNAKEPPKIVQQKISLTRPIAPTKKKIIQAEPPAMIAPKTESTPVKVPASAKLEAKKQEKLPEPAVKAEAKKTKKLPWNDQKVMGIVKSEFEKKHNFSQTLASIGMDYKISRRKKDKLYDYFTKLMGI
jgi:hypothetical protein